MSILISWIKRKSLPIAIILLTTWGCATYHEKNAQLHGLITSGKYDAAEQILARDNKSADGVNRFLYWCNSGVVTFMNGKYELSNDYLNKADLYVEDFTRNLGSEALSLISNPMVKPYRAEDFEAVMIHYYKALNYIYLNNYEEALVEARRINILLNKFNEKYKVNKNKYSRDAFAHNLMGLIYEASGDANNAFIAYRNALEVYEEDYTKLFNVSPPLQLKKDILRTAAKLGFGSELHFFETKFDMKYEPEDPNTGYLVFFWMNGFCPLKDEWSINFVNTGFNDGWITLVNEEYGLTFPVYIGNRSSNEQNAFKNLSVLRVAFPKYVERQPLLHSAQISTTESSYPLEQAEDVNKIAFQCLNDRMLREIASGIMRLATKKALEAAARNENENLGAIVSIVNAMTEKADTRNWQSLPYSISYCRVPLPEGMQSVSLETNGQKQTNEQFSFNIKKGQTTFFAFHNLETN